MCLQECHWCEINTLYTFGLQDALRHADNMGQQQNVGAELLAEAARASNPQTQGGPDLIACMPSSAVLQRISVNLPHFPLRATICKGHTIRSIIAFLEHQSEALSRYNFQSTPSWLLLQEPLCNDSCMDDHPAL